jgi:hypothetical protein
VTNEAIADFSHTATLLPLQIFDQNGNQVTDVSMISQYGGFAYPTASVVTPEPSSAWLLISAVTMLGLALRQRRLRSRLRAG